MKTIIVSTKVEYMNEPIVDEFEIDDDATEEQIEEQAKELAFELISWSYREKTDEDEEICLKK